MRLIENFFNSDECENAVSEVMQKESLWQKCQETHMYFLGNSYLRNSNFYNDQKNSLNLETATIFKDKISNVFGRTKFCKHLAHPGFQVIKKNESINPAVWHYDDILTCYPFHLEFPDYSNNFNDYFERFYIFTLMLSDSKSSFDYFPETESKFNNVIPTESPICKDHVDLIGDDCENKNCKLKKFQTIQYTKGSLLVQTQRVLHRVGLKDIDGLKSNRITMTGYGVVKNDIIFLFW